MNIVKNRFLWVFCCLIPKLLFLNTSYAQTLAQSTYCNPINLDYTYMIYNSHQDKSYRSGADPAVVEFRGEYYMFVTRSMGYWHSTDLTNWTFIEPEKWYFEGSNAPTAHNYKDSVLYVSGNPSGSMSVLYTDNPKKGDWKAVPGIINNLQDPHIFIDDDDQAYVFWGSSNKYPIRAKKLDMKKRFRPSEETYELFNLDMEKHGWERFGENHADTVLGGYMEGPWLTKHKGKYYMQYAAPGTEFNVYADGVYMSDDPLGPYEYAPNNPVSYKPGGFMNGAGHGSTVIGPGNSYWHFGSNAVSVNVNWERRIAMFPTFFDKDDLMYVDTYFGDYPHFSPSETSKNGEFTGWMLLSLNKPVIASSFVGDHKPEQVTDENVKSFWLAENENKGQWLEIDLMAPSTIKAIQINYHDHESNMYGRLPGLFHRYKLYGSNDRKNWEVIVNKEKSFKDTPNDYVVLSEEKKYRYVKYENIHVPTPNLAISGLRIFGIGSGKLPSSVKDFQIERELDDRDAFISWKRDSTAQGYNILWGIAPDKLYNSWMVYGDNELDLKSLTKDQIYYFTIEAFNENGVSERSDIIKVN
ncbi:family 43 glycosylhydrolase [Belliella sp. DSM 107340]|uniref:Family 43 glycosylhydrolase n=1 Tax=Belliella calami TaxID=2923436 RepID=A0ABS9UN80_9BACT|nr:family 43 glycosylhydrolase [Belliella calami]MCH7398084.1 family 43 glycosylhydrolase [Belliella calami]